mgnify:CR=1 FL=1|tara:strand:+ start:382 stop:777 length:396 start_codon:yes stop_codon:yes gene_type:complete
MGDKHYDEGGISTKDILQAKLTPEQYKGFLLGNIIKYSTRANFKNSFEDDVRKAGVYSGFLQELERPSVEINMINKVEEHSEAQKLFLEMCDRVADMLTYGKEIKSTDLLPLWDSIRQPIHDRLFENKKES